MLHKKEQIKINQMNPLSELASFSYYASTEGVVLLKNNGKLLPLLEKRIAVFGRIQFDYYKSGTGSGGLVNVNYVPSIIESLKRNPRVVIDNYIFELYQKWIEEHPFDQGSGQWASEPWAQVEMELDDKEILEASKRNDVAIIVFGRTAGEDRDHSRQKGSYYLTDNEEKLLKQVTSKFKHTVVVLNVGSVIDLSFMDRYKIDSLVLAWHGGMYGALGLVDVLTGYVTPSGKLPMTISRKLEDYPSDKTFGKPIRIFYEEDIYVGYRYFETFKKVSVRFPFGFGLSYTDFLVTPVSFDVEDKTIKFTVNVKNIGEFDGKEVIQIYYEAPQGLLGKPKKVLTAFSKTKLLKPNEDTNISFEIDLFKLASYDDEGLIYKSSYVLEKGLYQFYIGNSVRNVSKYGQIQIEDDLITAISTEINAPNIQFKRLKPDVNLRETFVDVPLRTVDYNQRIQSELKKPIEKVEKEINLKDVFLKKESLDSFIGSLELNQLIELTRGEGMSSPKVTPGTAAAFGGVTEELKQRGIPILCAADGPSGIRMDSGFLASSTPIGTHLASTFNLDLVETLYYLVGLEMRGYNIDVLLGPGMNIMRHPLNGRNFEYFSEDPLLTGLMASSFIKGLHKAGVSGSLKHLFGNNQETDRFNVDAVISERAQREIYLKGFEIAIKDGGADVIMTSYNPVNGIWTASNYEVNKKLVRDEWGFKGFIMTDWWAKMNDFGGEGTKTNTKAMIISTNDIYMVISDAKSNSNQDNTKVSIEEGSLHLSQLQETAKHILSYVMKSPAFARLHNIEFKPYKYHHRSWLKVIKDKTYIPTISMLNLNKKSYKLNNLEFIHVFENEDTFESLSAYVDLIELNEKFNHATLVKTNQGEQSIYHFYTKDYLDHSKPLVDLSNLKDEPRIQLKGGAWESALLSFDSIVQKTEGILIDENLEVTNKNDLISYQVDVESKGKYILEFQLSAKDNNLAQIPFSIFVDNHHKSTLTIHGTNGEMIETRTFILMDNGHHTLTFKFNKSGITFKQIKAVKHG